MLILERFIDKKLREIREIDEVAYQILSKKIKEPQSIRQSWIIAIKRVESYLNKLKKTNRRKIAIYGAGEHTKILLKLVDFSGVEITGIIDKYIKGSCDGYKIYPSSAINSLEYDAILISSYSFEDEIYREINNLIDSNKIEIFRIYVQDYCKKLPLDLTNVKEIINRINSKPQKKKILYTGNIAYFNLMRQSMYLRKTGEYETFFLTLNPGVTKFTGDYFDAIYLIDDLFLLCYILSKVKPYLVHVQGWMTFSYLPVVVKLFSNSKVICEQNDLTSLFISQEDFKHLWGEDEAQLEFTSERFIYEKMDGVIQTHSEEAEKAMRKIYNSKAPILKFHSYPCQEFFIQNDTKRKLGDPIKLVFGGSIPPSNMPKQFFGDVHLLNLIELVTHQGIQFDIFTLPHQKVNQGSGAYGSLWDYQYLEKANNNFSVRTGLPPNKIGEQIYKYDFGTLIYLFPDYLKAKKKHFDTICPTKLFTYIEAGLPILVSEELRYVAKIVCENNIGIVLSQKDLYNLKDIILGCDYKKLRKNVIDYREKYCMERQINKVKEFYQMIVSG